MPAGGGEPMQLTDKLSRAVSPDGRLVAYIYRDQNDPWRLAVAPLEGGEPLKTFDVPATIAWLTGRPTVRAVTYVETRDGVSNIFARPLDGGAPRQLTDFKADRIFTFAYSPDGKQLALSRGTINDDVVLISNFK